MDALRDTVSLVHHWDSFIGMSVVSLWSVIVPCVCPFRAIDLLRWSSRCAAKRRLVSKPQAAKERKVSRSGAACAGFSLQCAQPGTLTVMNRGGDAVGVAALSRRASRICTRILLFGSSLWVVLSFSPYLFFSFLESSHLHFHSGLEFTSSVSKQWLSV